MAPGVRHPAILALLLFLLALPSPPSCIAQSLQEDHRRHKFTTQQEHQRPARVVVDDDTTSTGVPLVGQRGVSGDGTTTEQIESAAKGDGYRGVSGGGGGGSVDAGDSNHRQQAHRARDITQATSSSAQEQPQQQQHHHHQQQQQQPYPSRGGPFLPRRREASRRGHHPTRGICITLPTGHLPQPNPSYPALCRQGHHICMEHRQRRIQHSIRMANLECMGNCDRDGSFEAVHGNDDDDSVDGGNGDHGVDVVDDGHDHHLSLIHI